MAIDFFSQFRQDAQGTATPSVKTTTDKILSEKAPIGRPLSPGSATKRVLGPEENAMQERLSEYSKTPMGQQYGTQQIPLSADIARSFFNYGMQNLWKAGLSIGEGIVGGTNALLKGAEATGNYLGSKVTGKPMKKTGEQYILPNVSLKSVAQEIPRFGMNEAQRNVYDNEILAQSLEAEGKTQQAKQVRETGKVLKIKALNDQELINTVSPPGIIRNIAQVIARDAPVFAAGAQFGGAVVPELEAVSATSKAARIGQQALNLFERGAVTGGSTSFMQRNPAEQVKDQSKKMLADAAIFGGTDVALGIAGLGLREIYSKAKTGVQDMLYKKATGGVLSRGEEDAILNSNRVDQIAKSLGVADDDVPLGAIDSSTGVAGGEMKNATGKDITQYLRERDGIGGIYYHGTTEENAKKILEEGFKPGYVETSNISGHPTGASLTSDLEAARLFARHKSEISGGKPVVLKVDTSGIEPGKIDITAMGGGTDEAYVPIEELSKLKFSKDETLSPLDQLRSQMQTDAAKVPFYQKVLGGVVDVVKKFHEGMISKYQPLTDIQKAVLDISDKELPKVKLSERFEQVAGAQAKAEADLIKFHADVVDPMKGMWDQFNQYLALNRIVDRLTTDKETRAVGTWTVEKAQSALQQLKSEVGEKGWASMEIAGKRYQDHMDRALQLQMEAGNISPELYGQIKAQNQFYAPFKVMKNVDEVQTATRPGGVGRNISTTEDLTKGIKGIQDDDFILGDIMESSAQQIYKSRILAEKNLAMQELGKLRDMPGAEKWMQVLEGDAKPPRGWERVHVYENGEDITMAVDPRLYKAVQGLDRNVSGFLAKSLSIASTPMKAGATVANVPFNVVNVVFRDPSRLLQYFNYDTGVKGAMRFPLDMARGFWHAMYGNFAPAERAQADTLFMDFLSSGAGAGDVQTYLTPGAFRKAVRPPEGVVQKYLGTPIRSTIDSVAKFSRALEQTTKLAGWLRGIREVNGNFKIAGTDVNWDVMKRNPKYADAISELVTEVRNFAGSPDFARGGSVSPDLNLLFMFFNARVQGTAADLGRLTGMRGEGTARAWAGVGTVAAASMAARIYNQIYHHDDLKQLLPWEDQNYSVIFRDKTFINDNGEEVRDGFRIPKEGVSGSIATFMERIVDAAFERDPAAATSAGMGIIENLAPVNISGQNLLERAESFASNLNPLLRIPFEVPSGRDFFRHRDVIPQSLKDVSGKNQYNEATPELYKAMGEAAGAIGLPDVMQSPMRIQHGLNLATGGAVRQVEGKQTEDSRGFWANFLVTQRFFRSPWTNPGPVQQTLNEALTKQADRRIEIHREAEKLFTELKGQPSRVIEQRLKGVNKFVTEEVLNIAKDNKKGLDYTDRQVQRLGVTNGQRALFLLNYVQGLPKTQRPAFLQQMQKKGLLSPEVLQQMQELRSSQ